MSSNPIAEITAQLLIDLGQGVAHDSPTLEWNTFVGTEPDTPDKVITVIDTPGILEGRLGPGGQVAEQCGVLIRVRAESHSVGYAKIQSIVSDLLNRHKVYRKQVTVLPETETDGTTYTVHAYTQRGSIAILGRDESNSDRYIFTVNFTTTLV